jgi:hypothetical protein
MKFNAAHELPIWARVQMVVRSNLAFSLLPLTIVNMLQVLLLSQDILLLLYFWKELYITYADPVLTLSDINSTVRTVAMFVIADLHTILDT